MIEILVDANIIKYIHGSNSPTFSAVYALPLHFPFVARDYPKIFHSLDVWHKAKKLKKALEEVIYNHVDLTCVTCKKTLCLRYTSAG